MSNLRNKYAATPVNLLKKTVSIEDADFQKGQGAFLKLTEGKNRIRFFPSHDPKLNFYTLRAFYWLKNYADDDSGDETYNRTVLNARFHYPGAKFDLVEEYVAAAKAYIESSELEPEEKAAKLVVFSNWKTGINLSRGWMAYVLKINGEKREFGLLELNKTLRDKINQQVVLEDDDEPITVDPFTDPDNGRPIIINVDKTQKKADNIYSIKVSTAPLPLTDDELEVFDKAKPLKDSFIYTSRDWDSGIEGIKIFDETNDIDLFTDDEWLRRIEEIKAQFKFSSGSSTNSAKDEDDEDQPVVIKKKSVAPPVNKPSKSITRPPVEEDDEEEEEDEQQISIDAFTSMDREALKNWIAEEHERSENAGEVLRVKKSMSDDDIRAMIRNYKANSADDGDDEEEEEESPVVVAKPHKSAVAESSSNTGVISLNEVKKRLAELKK